MDKLFFVLYSVAATLVNIAALPFLYLLYKTKTKYKLSVPARFCAWYNQPLDANGIWFHVCSFGEARAIYPIIDLLPKDILRLTAITQTGYEAIRSKVAQQSRFLPFEPWLFSWIRPQRMLVVMEAELWYLLFAISKKRGSKTILINARISDRSFHRYKRAALLYRQIFKYVDEVYAQTELDKQRLELLGAKDIVVTGNIKLYKLAESDNKLKKKKTPMICAASTHEGEESIIMTAFMEMKAGETGPQLVLVPRHPERFDEVAEMVFEFSQTNNLSFARYSEAGLDNKDIIIVDVLGELVNIYSISDVVVMGGSFVSVGGHNAAEAAQFGCKIISGDSYYNQRDIYAAIEGIEIVSSDRLGDTLKRYKELPDTHIIHRVDIEPILDTIIKAAKER